ncbi:ATP-binding protein [Streptomyces sp. V1I6]|uniref:ATP-binding protein n=1 Tax=Streptomyces sp. V1I6 TaxID=3042273 RepID=UPI00278B5F26|nr:ATP-binding protein [Streptomyces sp. V1I6]MDQ0846058.1 anti-sigma regulatory factor (Ser/Thr protein kinase) [Streptomyces sp. V1I6]
MNGAITPHVAPAQPAAPSREFSMQFTSTPRGARLARRLVSHRLDEWGYPYDSTPNEAITLIAAEFTANAVRHGHVPGRDFHLRLTASPGPSPTPTPVPSPSATLRIEVADTRTERRPAQEVAGDPPPLHEESGRGLYLVARLADRWGVATRVAAPGKQVWAELHLPPVGPGAGPA